MKYRKKPVVVEAMLFDGNNVVEILDFISTADGWSYGNSIMITTLEGTMKASIGDYIIKGVNGEFYPCKPDIFEKTYEKENEDERN